MVEVTCWNANQQSFVNMQFCSQKTIINQINHALGIYCNAWTDTYIWYKLHAWQAWFNTLTLFIWFNHQSILLFPVYDTYLLCTVFAQCKFNRLTVWIERVVVARAIQALVLLSASLHYCILQPPCCVN